MNTRYLTLLTTLVFLGFTVCALAEKPFCGDGVCKGKNETPASCPDDCRDGGGGDEGGLGSAIPMDCLLGASWGDKTVPSDTIKDDTLDWYEDEVDRVTCSIEGPSVPWPIYLKVWRDKGKPPNLIRKVDVALGAFDAGTFATYDTDWALDNLSLQTLYENFFKEALGEGGPNMDEMDALRLNVRPYRGDPILGDPTQTTESIHRLAWQNVPYEMGMHFGKPDTGIDRFAISIASLHYKGNENFTGIACEIDDPKYVKAILANSPEGAMRDVSVYLWRDADKDGLPDGYTVTTGEIKDVDETLDGPPDVIPGTRWAAVCSAVGPDAPCGNPKASSNCNFLGYVEMKFTLHACASALCEVYDY
jgi:hypothetical protein